MIYLDTSVLLAWIFGEDRRQCSAARAVGLELTPL